MMEKPRSTRVEQQTASEPPERVQRSPQRIEADLSKQVPNNTYSPRSIYEDMGFRCRDCGKHEVWTAEQQQWWYEVAKGPVQSTAIRCRACREAHHSRP